MTQVNGERRPSEAGQQVDAEALIARVEAELDQIATALIAQAGNTETNQSQIMDQMLLRQAEEVQALRFTVRTLIERAMRI